MTVSIDKTLETIDDVGKLMIDVVALMRSGVSRASLGRARAIVGDLCELASDAPAALPELADLDSDEAIRLGGAAYTLVKKILIAGL